MELKTIKKLRKNALKLITEFGKSAKGRIEYLKFLRGEHISYKQACIAKCYECNNGYVDGRHSKQDCEQPHCPMYNFMPYKDVKFELRDDEE